MSDHKKLITNESGIAIGMVLTAVVILTTIVANFTFESNISKIKAYNIEDRAKAKLTAESGLQFAMARLRLYKEAYNFLQENESAQSFVKQESLNLLWNFPFVYPVPMGGNLTVIQKESIQKFQESAFLDGNLNLTINNVSNKLNLNLIRISLLVNQEQVGEEAREEASEYNVEAQLFNILKTAIEAKKETDEDFFQRMSGIEVQDLVNELKYYVSDPKTVEGADAQRRFEDADLSPKKAPITSYSELYTLPSWTDDLVEIIQNEFTVHGALMVDLNKITDKLLKVLIPEMEKEDIEEFYKYKDDPDNPKFFNALEDFKNYIVGKANIISTSAFDDRFNKLLKQGIQFGPTPTLFKIRSTANKGRATYTITAYVIFPAQPKPDPKPQRPEEGENGENTEGGEDGENTEAGENGENAEGGENGENTEGGEEEEQKTLLLEPRIVEIIIS